MIARLLILAAAFAMGGCSTLADYGPISKKSIKNEQGNVIGYKQLLRNKETGEVVARVSLFSPILSDSGAIVGYEEPAKSGSIIRDIHGRSIGGRFSDTRGKGFTLVVRARGFDQALESENVASAKRETPGVMQILASLSDKDLRAIR
jgi:hypothetical protein